MEIKKVTMDANLPPGFPPKVPPPNFPIPENQLYPTCIPICLPFIKPVYRTISGTYKGTYQPIQKSNNDIGTQSRH